MPMPERTGIGMKVLLYKKHVVYKMLMANTLFLCFGHTCEARTC